MKHEARDETLEDDWIELEDDFVFVTAIYLSHLAGDMWTMPPSQLHEDTVYLYCLRYGIVSAEHLLRIILLFVGQRWPQTSKDMPVKQKTRKKR